MIDVGGAALNDPIIDDWKTWSGRLGTGRLYERQDFVSMRSQLAPDVIHELGTFYSRALDDDHVSKLNIWLSRNRGITPMPEDERGVRNLIHLFGHLGGGGWQPFNTYQLKSDQLVPPTPDWSKLPDGFAFLAEPAMRCGKFEYAFSPAFRERAREIVPADELAELTATAQSIREAGYRRLNDWRKRLGVAEHVEAAMVFNLLGVLDALELRYYD
jgi:hypothetical protein